MSDSLFDVAVVGATGAVGQVMLSILEQRDFPVGRLFPLASARSAGKTIQFKGEEIEILDLANFDFSQVKIGLFSAGGSVSAEYAPKAAAAGCVVIDNTSHFRREADIPLVVPEVNPHQIANYGVRGIIANPNCSTIQMLVALKPIHDAVRIKRINVATYQAVSGTGQSAIDELGDQTRRWANAQEMQPPQAYPVQIAFNALPQIDTFQENGYTREEMKMVWETKKIFEDESILVNPTCVRIPVFYGHSEALAIETEQPISAEQARQLLAAAPGVTVMDQREAGGYPTPAIDGEGADATFVGRIREDISHSNGLNLWVVSDNLRKGAALNSVQIAEVLVREHF